MSDLPKLRQDHADLIGIVDQLSQLVGQSSAPPQLELFNLRRKLNSTLIGHLKAEDWVLYPRLTSSPDRTIAETARAFDEEMGGLAAAFAAYNEKWSAPEIQADWSGYCIDTRRIIEALRNRIAREDRDLYPLLEQIDKAA